MGTFKIISIDGTVVSGHRVASGLSPTSPYPEGTIEMQTPHFFKLGLDLFSFYPGTLNVSIAPHTFELMPTQTLHHVKWSPDHDPESFSFIPISLVWQLSTYSGFVYYPRPETKIDHFQDPSVLELILPKIEGITYGDKVALFASSTELIMKP